MATTDDNCELVLRYFQKIDEGDLSVIDDFVSPDFIDHAIGAASSADRTGLRTSAEKFLAAVPDGYHRVEEVIAVGDRVIARIRGYGTHTGELMGVPPSGRIFTATGIVIWRIAAGKIVERWSVVDTLGMLKQLGAEVVVPTPASA